MYKIIIKITILITSIMMPAYTNGSSIDEKFVSDNKKICAAKDNSSAELLIRTVIACQNVGKNSQLLPLFYLATDQHDQLMNITMQENGTFTVGKDNTLFNFPLIEWRHQLEKVVKLEDQKYVLHILNGQRKAIIQSDSSKNKIDHESKKIDLNIEKPRQVILKNIGKFVI